MNESYVDPTSKYYIDRMWEEYHKVKKDLAAVHRDATSAWQDYHKMKEELADTKSKLAQSEDYINEILKPELADAKIKLKMAQSAWDELDKSHTERAKLHDELIIAEGQRDQWKMQAEKAEAEAVNAWKEVFELRAKEPDLWRPRAVEEKVKRVKAEAERDALRTRAEAAEAELEIERMRLAACGVAALGYFNGCEDVYKSASLDDVLKLTAERDELQLQVGDWKDVAEQFRDALVERGKVLGFFASVIKSGEPWTPQCDEMLRATFVHKDTAPEAQPSTDTWEDTRARCS